MNTQHPATRTFTELTEVLFSFSDGAKWKKRRKLITPTFHFRILNDFIQVCEEQAAILVTNLQVMSSSKLRNDKGFFFFFFLDMVLQPTRKE